MLLELSALPEQETNEEILSRLDWYIVSQVQHLRRSSLLDTRQAVQNFDTDELIQRVRIKFWQALERRDIHHPHAYIQLIVRSEFIDMVRKQKPVLPLPTEEEWNTSEVQKSRCWNMPDPAEEVEERLDTAARLREVIQAVLELPPRQRFAMLCSLRDRVDDLVQLIQTFREYKIDIEAIHWPSEKSEKQLLRASLSQARKTLAHQTTHKKKGRVKKAS